MKNISIKLIFGFIMIFIGVTAVRADNSCSVTKKSELMTMASKLSVTYEVYENDYTGESTADEDIAYAGVDFFDVKIYNLNSKLRIEAINETNNKTYYVTYRDIVEDGSVTIRRPVSSKVTNYKFIVTGADDCRNTTLRTFRLTLPRANYLANMEQCLDIQDFYLCQPYVTFEIDDSVALKTIDEYIKKQETKQKNEEKEKGNTSVISKTLTGFSNHRKIFSVVIILIGVCATVLILRKRKSGR